MPDYVIPPPPVVTLPLAKGGVFPVRRVYCVGRNYAAHAVEMGHDPDREPPFFFQKNPDDLNPSGTFAYPRQSRDVHFEAELAVLLHSGGATITPDDALSHVFGYAPALDMTRRDLQAAAKSMGRPWEVGKAFAGSAPIGLVQRASDIGHPNQGRITLHQNGNLRQDGDLRQMIWSVPDIISDLSRCFQLSAGDVILTGTPAGVGPVAVGDVLVVKIEGVGEFTTNVTP